MAVWGSEGLLLKRAGTRRGWRRGCRGGADRDGSRHESPTIRHAAAFRACTTGLETRSATVDSSRRARPWRMRGKAMRHPLERASRVVQDMTRATGQPSRGATWPGKQPSTMKTSGSATVRVDLRTGDTAGTLTASTTPTVFLSGNNLRRQPHRTDRRTEWKAKVGSVIQSVC